VVGKYLSSWFGVDFVSSIPADSILCAVGVDIGEHAATIRVLKVPRRNDSLTH
jgi:hypothetical protein